MAQIIHKQLVKIDRLEYSRRSLRSTKPVCGSHELSRNEVIWSILTIPQALFH
jgi:hypothetical protein